jgi:SAM-dependent methyltransferase
VTRYIQKSGRYILDAASGPIQYEEYLAYSKHYALRICVDISLLALKEASGRIGQEGLFIQANITNLPLAENCVDAVISLHTVYHVPSEEQFIAFRELHRVLKPGATAAIVYSWGWRSPLMTFMLLPFAVLRWPLRLFRLLRARLTKPVGTTNEPTLYFSCHRRKRLEAELRKFCDFDLVVWRSVNILFLRVHCHSWLFGRQLLSLVVSL